MHIVTRKHLNQAAKKYPDAAKEIGAWVAIVKEVRWHNFPETRGTFKDADNVKGYVIFNIRQNRYRLVTAVHHAKTTKKRQTEGHVYIVNESALLRLHLEQRSRLILNAIH